MNTFHDIFTWIHQLFIFHLDSPIVNLLSQICVFFLFFMGVRECVCAILNKLQASWHFTPKPLACVL